MDLKKYKSDIKWQEKNPCLQDKIKKDCKVKK